MSREKQFDSLEEKLREAKPRRLPAAWRGEILDTALGATTAGLELREAVGALFPRPLVLGLAAAWVLILVLRVSMPGEEGAGAAAPGGAGLSRGAEVDLVMLAERVRVIVTGELERNGTL